MNAINTKFLNDVNNRFLPLPRNATEEYEPEPKVTDFDIIKELGVGSFGKVYLVSHKKTKHKFALKSIDKLDEVNYEEKSYFSREIEIMYKLNHPNICKLFSHFEDNKYCYLLLQYIPKGSAFDLIPKNGKKQQNMKLIASVMKDLISAIYYLHNMQPTIVHRDIKPENILLDENSKAYLTDFGWSNYIRNHRIRNTICGTPLYLPPEMVAESGHNEKADIWCIGVLLFELSTGKVPFEGEDYSTVKYNISRLNIHWPSDIEPDIKDLISKILKKNPNERLTIEKILSHNFFTKYFPNAVKELIKPDNQLHKIFIVSSDDPNTWTPTKSMMNPIKVPKKLTNKNVTNLNNLDNNNNTTNSINNTNKVIRNIKKTKTMYYKTNMDFSPIKENKNKDNQANISKNNNHKEYVSPSSKHINEFNKQKNTSSNNNYNTIESNTTKNVALKINNNINKNDSQNTNANNNDPNKYKKITINTKNYTSNNKRKNSQKINLNKNFPNTNSYNRKTVSTTSKTNSTTDNNFTNSINCFRSRKKVESPNNTKELENKYSDLTKKYESLKKEYNHWKNNEIEKLKKELKEKENTLTQLIHQNKPCDFPENENNFKKLETFYEDLKFENNELKTRIKNYSKLLTDKKKNDINLNNNKRNSGNKNAMFSLNNLDSKTQKNIDAIIKEKDNQIDKYKEELRVKREKEKERFAILINKYDRALIGQERENKDLRSKLKELERQFY